MYNAAMSRFRIAPIALVLCALLSAVQPGPPANDFHFSILGDRTHLGSAEVYERIWKEIGQLHPDFVINVGDSIEGGNDSRAAAQWQELRRIWLRYPYPVYLTPGNHDIWNDFSRRLFEKEAGRPHFYAFNFQNAHFTVLDNSGSLLLDAEQLRFLEEDLKANRNRAPKFVFFHQPFWVVFLRLGSGEFPLHRLAREYGVDYVVSGHGHQLVRIQRDGITYLEVGSSGGDITRGTSRGGGLAEGWFYQHVWVTVEGPRAQLQVKQLDGPLRPLDEKPR
jgi:3',5'-cyclic AMP phosphodiesterase CpdA